MFKPMSPYHREELPSDGDFQKRWDEPPQPVVKETPKPSNSIPNLERLSLEEMKAMWAQISLENPTMSPSERNGDIIVRFLKENGPLEFNLENLRIAVKVLGYPKDQLDRRKPPPPPAPSQPVVVEPPPFDFGGLSDTDELPLDTPEWRLRTATSAQLRSFLKRAVAAKKT